MRVDNDLFYLCASMIKYTTISRPTNKNLSNETYKSKANIGSKTYVLNCINTCPTLNTEDVVFAEYERAMFRALDSLMVNQGVA